MSSTQTSSEDDNVPWRDRFRNLRRPRTRRLADAEAGTGRSTRPAPKKAVTTDDFRGRPNGYVPRKTGPAPSHPKQIVNGILVKEPKSPWRSIPEDLAPTSAYRIGRRAPWSSMALSLPPANSRSPVKRYRRPVTRRVRFADEPPAGPDVPVAQAYPTLEEMLANPSLYGNSEPPSRASSPPRLDALLNSAIQSLLYTSTVDQRSSDGGIPGHGDKDDGRRADGRKRKIEGKKGGERQKRHTKRSGPGATEENPIEIEDDSYSDAALTTTSSRASSCTLDGDVHVPAGDTPLEKLRHTSGRPRPAILENGKIRLDGSKVMRKTMTECLREILAVPSVTSRPK